MRGVRKALRREHREADPYGSIALSLSEFSELVGAIYQGPLEPVPWKKALDLLRRHLRANYVTLMLRPPSHDREALMVNAAGDWFVKYMAVAVRLKLAAAAARRKIEFAPGAM